MKDRVQEIRVGGCTYQKDRVFGGWKYIASDGEAYDSIVGDVDALLSHIQQVEQERDRFALSNRAQFDEIGILKRQNKRFRAKCTRLEKVVEAARRYRNTRNLVSGYEDWVKLCHALTELDKGEGK